MPELAPKTPENGLEIGRFDKKMLEYASDGLSPEEIAEKLPGDQTPAMIAFRIKQIVSGRTSWLTVAEERALHLADLQRLKKKAWEMLDQEEGNRALTGLANIMQQIGLRIDIAAAQSEEMMGQIRRAQAREFAAALEMMYDGVVRRLHSEYPDVDKRTLRTLMGEEMQKAVARIDALVESDD
jgi:acyl-CoA reductase-like NAD-dependent aldehyde dehydrogenase